MEYKFNFNSYNGIQIKGEFADSNGRVIGENKLQYL